MLHRRVRATVPLFALIAALLVAPVAAARAQDLPPDPALTVTQGNGVVREVLGSGLPSGAPGQGLVLLRFTFQPGAIIPPHIHPGVQTAYVLSGTLGYTVLCGYALVTPPPAGDDPPRTERRDPGPEFLLGPGGSLVEIEGLVHSGRNAGPSPLVLLASSLLAADMPASIPTDPATAPQCGR